MGGGRKQEGLAAAIGLSEFEVQLARRLASQPSPCDRPWLIGKPATCRIGSNEPPSSRAKFPGCRLAELDPSGTRTDSQSVPQGLEPHHRPEERGHRHRHRDGVPWHCPDAVLAIEIAQIIVTALAIFIAVLVLGVGAPEPLDRSLRESTRLVLGRDRSLEGAAILTIARPRHKRARHARTSEADADLAVPAPSKVA